MAVIRNKKNKNDIEKIIMPFGKYKGEYLGDIFSEDRSYLEWLAEQNTSVSMEAGLLLRSTNAGK